MMKTRKNNNLHVTVIAAVLATAMLTACDGDGGNTSTETTTPIVQEPTKATEPTEVPDEPVEVEPEPDPTIVEEDLIIDGYNITQFNRRDADVAGFIANLTYDEPRLIVALDDKDLDSQDIITIAQFGESIAVPKDQDVIYYVYAPHDISNIDGDNVSLEARGVSIDGGKAAHYFRLNSSLSDDYSEIKIYIRYSDDQYNVDIMKGCAYSFFARKE